MIQDYFPEVRGTECPTQQITSHQNISLPFQNTGDKERFRDREKVTGLGVKRLQTSQKQ